MRLTSGRLSSSTLKRWRAVEGKEVAVYRIQDDKVAETSFHQDNVDLDRRFWE